MKQKLKIASISNFNANDENKFKNHNKLLKKIIFKKSLLDLYFIFFFLMLLMKPQLYSFKKVEKLNFSYDNFIVLTITKVGDSNRILSGEAGDDILPNSIKINNDNEITSGITKEISLTSDLNTVILTWNTPLTSCKNMFKKVPYITAIDLSNFDFSSVTDMSSFFDQCSQVQSINIMNGYTKNIWKISYLMKKI